MLQPDYLASLPDAVVEALDTMMEAVLQVTARRIAKYGWTEQTQWEIDRLEAIGFLTSDIQRVIKEHSPDIAAEISQAFEEAMQETVHQDQAFYEAAGAWSTEAIDQKAVQNVIRSGLTQTAHTFSNLTGTLAKETAVQFAAAMDQAWIAAATGVITPQEAGRRAISQLCRDGIKVVSYPSGHQDTIEVATRRALLTGINQTAMKVQDQMLLDLDGDLVEVTAHAGARPSHAEWQGKVFSRWGKTEGYVTLEAGTGYGTGAGLGGWNCRHSYHPFFEGYTPAYTQEQLAAYNKKKYTYDSKELTEYEAMQQQRYFERGIRRWKREYLTAEAMGEDTTEAAVRLKQWRERETDFLTQTGRRKDSSRSQVGGFSHSQASKATWQNRIFDNYAAGITGIRSSTGIVISEMSPHLYTRCQERNVVQTDIVDALTSPLKAGNIRADKSQQFVGNKATVVVNTETGKLVTVWPTSTKTSNRLKKGGKS